jgi:hypothetical protein
MYVDGYMLLAIYSIAVLALGVSVYALWTLKEVEEIYKKKNAGTEEYHSNKAKQTPRLKGPWK